MVRRVDTCRIVDRVGVDAPAGKRELDAPELGTAEVAAFGEDLAAQVAAVDAQRVVGAVSHLRMGFARRLHVGADAAVVDQVDRRLEDRVDELGRRHCVGRDAERLLHFGRDRNRLRAARMHAAAGRNELGVVVGPRRARQLEQALSLGEAALRVRDRVEKDVAVVEGRDELDVRRQQHAVAEHVARHVADAGNGKIGRLGVDAHLAEMPLDRFPGAARGDAHHLVVITCRPARGERIAQPEAVLLADGVGVVGERCRSLVRRDDEVRIIGVVTLDVRRRNDLVAHAVIGQVEQAPQIVLIAGHPFLEVRLAIRGRRRALEHEPPLGADRNDHGILDHLRLDQPQHLGPEVLRPIRPSQATARDFASAQVHTLETRRVDENLELGLRLGQPWHFRRIELER